MTIAEAIKKLRLDLLLSQAEFARALNITPGAISRYESGEREPNFATIRKINELVKKNKVKINLEDFIRNE